MGFLHEIKQKGITANDVERAIKNAKEGVISTKTPLRHLRGPSGTALSMEEKKLLASVIRYGKLSAAWTPGDATVTLTPCYSADDATANGQPDVECRIFADFTTDIVPSGFSAEEDDILAYVLVDETANPPTGFLVAPPALPGGLFPVKVEKDGGSDGSKTTTASWTYTVQDLAGNQLGTGVALTHPRPKGKMTYQTGTFSGGTAGYGTGFYDGATFKLWSAGEIPGSGGCPTT